MEPFVGLAAICVGAGLLVTKRLARRIQPDGGRWFSRAVVLSGLIAGVTALIAAVWLIIAVAGDSEPATVRLHNGTDDDIFLAVPLTQPTERSTERYSRIPPGGHGFPADERRAATSETCLTSAPGRIVTIDDDYEFVRYFDDEARIQRTEDPPASVVTVLAELPANECYPERDPWIEFTGTAIVPIDDPTWGITDTLLTAALAIAVVLCGGYALDRLSDRRVNDTEPEQRSS